MLTGEQSVAKSLHRLSVVRGGIIVGGIIVSCLAILIHGSLGVDGAYCTQGVGFLHYDAHRLVLIKMQRGAKMQLPRTELCQLGS